MKIWGIHKKYKSLSWEENFLGGHLSIGSLTIYGDNAMDWTINLGIKRWGYICWTIPTYRRIFTKNGKRKGWYYYLSPDATPWSSTYYRGSDKEEKIRAQIRKMNFGHGFNTDKYSKELYALNNKFEWLTMTDYDVEKFKYVSNDEPRNKPNSNK